MFYREVLKPNAICWRQSRAGFARRCFYLYRICLKYLRCSKLNHVVLTANMMVKCETFDIFKMLLLILCNSFPQLILKSFLAIWGFLRRKYNFPLWSGGRKIAPAAFCLSIWKGIRCNESTCCTAFKWKKCFKNVLTKQFIIWENEKRYIL